MTAEGLYDLAGSEGRLGAVDQLLKRPRATASGIAGNFNRVGQGRIK